LLIIHGTYSFKRRIVAFRDDYCLGCSAPRVAYLHRTFDVWHLFYIPLLPLGFWKKWKCATCGKDPHTPIGTRYAFKWAGIVVLAILSATCWLIPIEKGDEAFDWSARIGFPIAFMFTLWVTLHSKRDENLKDKIAEIRSSTTKNCPRCGSPVPPLDKWHCFNCGIERRELSN